MAVFSLAILAVYLFFTATGAKGFAKGDMVDKEFNGVKNAQVK